MFSQIILSSFAVAAVVLAQSFSVNTATIAPRTCVPYRITWTGGVAPYIPAVTVAREVNQVLKQFDSTPSQFVLWTVDQPVGTQVTFYVLDSAGANAASDVSAPIVAGDSSCLNGGSSSAGGSSTAASTGASTSAPATTSAAPTTSAPATSSSSSSRPPSTSSTSTAPKPSSTGNTATSVRGTSAVVAAVVGVAVAALI